MIISHFDHALAYLPEQAMDQALQKFRLAGFEVYPQRIRHPGGKLSSFVVLTGSYLEFISVVDEAEFANSADRLEILKRKRGAPFTVAGACYQSQQLYLKWRDSLPGLPAPHIEHVEGDPDGPPGWAILRPPPGSTPGSEVLIVEYLRRSGQSIRPVNSANGVYAIGGFVFYGSDAAACRGRWLQTFSPAIPNISASGNRILFGAQYFEWTDSELFSRSNIISSEISELDNNSLSSIVLLTADLSATRTFLEGAGFLIEWSGEEQFKTKSDDLSGYSFLVERGPGSRSFASCLDNLRLKYST